MGFVKNAVGALWSVIMVLCYMFAGWVGLLPFILMVGVIALLVQFGLMTIFYVAVFYLLYVMLRLMVGGLILTIKGE